MMILRDQCIEYTYHVPVLSDSKGTRAPRDVEQDFLLRLAANVRNIHLHEQSGTMVPPGYELRYIPRRHFAYHLISGRYGDTQ